MGKRSRVTLALAAIFAAVGAAGLAACGGDNSGGNGNNNGDASHTSHSYTETVVPPTCVEQGYTLHKCACGEEYRDGYVNATGVHTFTSYTYNNDATCVADGTETATCEHCDETNTRIKINSKSDEHNYEDFLCKNCNYIDPQAPDTTQGITFEEVPGGYTVKRVDGRGKTYIKIPNSYRNKSVISINGFAFNNCEVLQSVALSANIKKIGCNAFIYCNKLVSICFNGEIDDWCQMTFDAPTTGNPVPFICCENLFIGEELLCELDLSDTIPSFNAWAFNGYERITKISVDDNNNKYYAEGNCLIEKTNKNLVLGCTNSIIPQDIVSIGTCAFTSRNSAEEITFPDSLSSIGSYAYYRNSTVDRVSFPENLTEIGNYAFSGCELSEVIIPENVETAGIYAIEGSRILTIKCKAAQKPVGFSDRWNSGHPVVWDCEHNTIAEDGYEYVIIDGVNYAIRESLAMVAWQSAEMIVGNIVIPSNISYGGDEIEVKEIKSGAFSQCINLTGIVVPDSITVWNDYAFLGCEKLESIILPQNLSDAVSSNPPYLAQPLSGCNSLRYAELPTGLIKYLPKSIVSVEINGGTKIEAFAFADFTKLEQISIPNSIVEIGHNAFKSCALTNIDIPDSVTSIGSFAFWGCVDLRQVKLPVNIESIEESTFYYCSSLSSVVIPDGVNYIGENAFSDCSNLKEVKLPQSLRTIDSYAFLGCSKLMEITIPSNVTKIGNSAFVDCNLLTINCEASSCPAGWDRNWNSDNRPVVWGHRENEE